jgi:hypothetical protein
MNIHQNMAITLSAKFYRAVWKIENHPVSRAIGARR